MGCLHSCMDSYPQMHGWECRLPACTRPMGDGSEPRVYPSTTDTDLTYIASLCKSCPNVDEASACINAKHGSPGAYTTTSISYDELVRRFPNLMVPIFALWEKENKTKEVDVPDLVQIAMTDVTGSQPRLLEAHNNTHSCLSNVGLLCVHAARRAETWLLLPTSSSKPGVYIDVQSYYLRPTYRESCRRGVLTKEYEVNNDGQLIFFQSKIPSHKQVKT